MEDSNGKGRLYEYAVLYHPEPEEDGVKRLKSELIVGVKQALVRSQQEAMILAAREIPEKYLDKLDEVEIAVRPF